MTTAFNSWYADRIELNFGVFEGVKGKVWVDDLEIEEVGLMNVLRRKGTPLTVRDEATGIVYEEGRDFAMVTDPNLDFHWTHEMPSIHLLPAGRIQDGARLRVSYYHGTTIYNDQVSACPSEAQTYEIWKQQFPLIEKYLSPKRYFLNVDEVRLFNRCEACRSRQMEAAAILGQMTQWLYNQVRAVNPKAEVLFGPICSTPTTTRSGSTSSLMDRWRTAGNICPRIWNSCSGTSISGSSASISSHARVQDTCGSLL